MCYRQIQTYSESLVEYKQIGHAVQLEPFLQPANSLRSISGDPRVLTGIYVDEDGNGHRTEASQLQNDRVDCYAHQCRFILYYLLGLHEAAKADYKKCAHLTSPGTYYLTLFYDVFKALNECARAAKRFKTTSKSFAKIMKTFQPYCKVGAPDVLDMVSFPRA